MKPWIDLARYREVRLSEALSEVELANKFLELNLVRNAAGKVFQAWKALLGALAVDVRDELARVFNRDIELEDRVIKEVDYVIALIPTTRMREIARIIETRYPGTYSNTLLALELHRYRYNGPDPEGVLSIYRSDKDALIDLEKLIDTIKTTIKRIKNNMKSRISILFKR
ncbi:PaREP1 domain containing protein [Vulcanisaeta moutnovskia 768-28]|uniref:PaREP1 domain containing protein n=1 Tax=Vulcanisaeta moutnovskia (strain 768-28) TaxID=985053 RepID=F0QWA8_VULM7|nr:PaREP1 family protein [Vulcanisaeta moutnovskia]ADY02203.1 PaREP1 domain containing protein [Vulcanisaeta moutnovskia 768-28]